MENLSPTTLSLLLAGLPAGILLVLLSLGVSNPILWRLGLRNVLRRPGQTVVMLAGLMLAAALITASFGLQDSFNQSAAIKHHPAHCQCRPAGKLAAAIGQSSSATGQAAEHEPHRDRLVLCAAVARCSGGSLGITGGLPDRAAVRILVRSVARQQSVAATSVGVG